MKKIYKKIFKIFILIKAKKNTGKPFFNKKYHRIYHFHIRKTGGTSVNKIFLNIHDNNSKVHFKKLVENNIIKIKNTYFAGWDKRIIESGRYHYGFSHIPYHKISIPNKTFTITCLRDPISRVVSHYKMLKYYNENNINHPCMEKEGKWLGKNFNDFLSKIPKEHLLNQLYMFSESFNIDEAYKNINNLSYYFFTDSFNKGISEISKEINVELIPIHVHKSSIDVDIPKKDIDHLKKILEPEYELYNKLKRNKEFQLNNQ